jgi:hypothetical protein
MYAGSVGFDWESNENNYRFLSAHWEWYSAIQGFEGDLEAVRRAANEKRSESLCGAGLIPTAISIKCTKQDALAGVKIALATLTMAIISAYASNYSSTGVGMVCMVMGGNQLGSSFSKSYTRLLGIIGGLVLPTLVMDSAGCSDKLLVGTFLFFWLWAMGLLYAGKFDNRASPATQGLAYSGVISAYTALGVILAHDG